MSLNEILNSDNLKPILGIGAVSLFTLGMAVVYCQKGEKKVDYVIVLGAQVRGTRITKSLRKRLDRALDYLEKQPEAITTGIIPSFIQS